MTRKTTSMARLVGAAAALLALGCGSGSGGGGSNPAAMFVGAWTFGSGSIQPTCNLQGIPSFDLTGDTMTITRVSDTEVATSLTGSGVMCNVNFNVSGTTATAQSGQTCLVTVMVNLGTPMTIPINIAIDTWTLNVSGDTLTIAMTGSASYMSILTCSPTADGTATRSGDAGT